LTTFTVATNDYRSAGNERTEYHACVAWDRLAEICGQFVSKGQLVDVEGRLQTRQWDDDAGRRHWKTEIVVSSLEMLSGRAKKDYAREAQAVATAPEEASAARRHPRLRRRPMARGTSRSRHSSRCDRRAAAVSPPVAAARP
jgi:single stranded DNA-binding protein